MSPWPKGKKMTPEHIEKLRKAQRGASGEPGLEKGIIGYIGRKRRETNERMPQM